MATPTNGATAPGEGPKKTAQPIYIGGYRISPDKVKWFLIANVLFVITLMYITTILLPLGIPFLAVKKAEGFASYVGFFFAYMFGYFAFFILVTSTLSASGYAIQKRYFPA